MTNCGVFSGREAGRRGAVGSASRNATYVNQAYTRNNAITQNTALIPHSKYKTWSLSKIQCPTHTPDCIIFSGWPLLTVTHTQWFASHFSQPYSAWVACLEVTLAHADRTTCVQRGACFTELFVKECASALRMYHCAVRQQTSCSLNVL